ncbi:MAG: host specificity protein J [Betaproteobacteria bacterium]|nr:MAG: host specificity protein J [Betaproteobacteria bacterium]
MPTSIIAAVAGAVIGAWAEVTIGTILFAGLVRGVVGAVVSGVVGGVLRGDTDDDRGTPTITQQGRMLTVRQAAAPWQVIYGERRVGGVFTFIEVSSDNQTLHLVITLAGHECNAIGNIYFDDEVVSLDGSGNATGRYAGYVHIEKSLGNEGDVQPFATLQAASAGKWTLNHKQRGRTKLYVRLTANPDLFPSGTPNITAVVQGRKMYDPRSTLTAYSANVALCANDYLTNATFGLGATYATEIDETTLIAAANLCDEDVSLAAGGTEDRYRCGGAFDLTVQPREVLGRLLAAMAGHAVNVGGKWYLFGGAYEAPTITLDEGDLAGPIRVQSLVGRRENANGVKGKFTDPNSSWQVTDFPALGSSTYMAEDGGERVWKDIDLSAFVTSGTQAQRLAKIELLSLRQGLSFVAPFKLTAYQVQTGRTFAMNNTKFGWSGKAFRADSGRFTVNADGTLGFEIAGREIASTIWDWNSSEEQTVDAAPNSNLPDPFTTLPPGAPEVTESLYVTRDGGGTKAKASATWAASTDPYSDRYQLEYKLVTDPEYTVRPTIRATADEVLDIAPGFYDWRVKAISAIGVSSAYSYSQKEIFGLSARPADVSGLTLQAAGGIAVLAWTLHPDLDVREGGHIQFRHSEATSGAVWSEAFTIGDAAPGNAGQWILPLKAGTYLAKAVDSSGLTSVNAASISTKQASIHAFSTLNTVQEDSTFSGTHSSTIAIDSVLKLLGSGMFDAIPDLDAVASLDAYGGVAASGTYTFATGVDRGSVERVRVTSQIDGIIVNLNDKIDSRTGSIDDWLNFDGTDGAEADAYVEMRETDDNPSGSPTWSAWNRLDASEHECRGLQFRARLSTTDPAYNVHIDTLRVRVDQRT